MVEPLFPIRSPQTQLPDSNWILNPYQHDGAWVFDDPTVGLVREPFVAGVSEMIDRLVVSIPGAASGFRLIFGVCPFEGYQTCLKWVRADPVEGNWYRAEDSNEEGWLCPALSWYFPVPPAKIYVRAEPKEAAGQAAPPKS